MKATISQKTDYLPMLQMVDYSALQMPGVTIYRNPADCRGYFVARVWDMAISKPTNICVKRVSLQELRADIRTAGFLNRIPRDRTDNPIIVESWI